MFHKTKNIRIVYCYKIDYYYKQYNLTCLKRYKRNVKTINDMTLF